MLAAPKLAYERSSYGQEREVKFVLDHASFDQLLASLRTTSPDTSTALTSVYFDTAGFDLCKAGIVVRVRHVGKTDGNSQSRVLGVKIRGDAGPFARAEEEVKIDADVPDIDVLSDGIRQRLAGIINGQDLLVQFSTRVERRIFLVNEANVQIEMAFDRGVVQSTVSSILLNEIELEQKSGSPAAFFDFASRFCLTHDLSLDFVSKSDKGFQMIGADVKLSSSGSRIKIKPSTPALKAAIAILNVTCDRFTGQWEGCRSGNDSEAIHQARVELRRLRSALAIFTDILPQPEAENLDKRCKDVADGFAKARKLDVFLETMTHARAEASVGQAAVNALRTSIETARQVAYRNVRNILNSPQTSTLVLDVHCFLERLDTEAKKTKKIGSFARTVLEKLNAKALERGRRHSTRTAPELHRLRITLKKLRYSAEFFADVLEHRKYWDTRIKIIKQLQETLGSLNDVAETRSLLDSELGAEAANHAIVTAYVLGWQTRDGAEQRRALQKLWQKFKTHKVKWSR